MSDKQPYAFQFSQADQDPLTGTWRRSILSALNKAFQSRPDGEVWSLMIMDIDHFKLINDIYGHVVGDSVLKQIADILLRTTRKNDVLLRYGGDEFVVVFPGSKQSMSMNYPQRILEELDVVVFPQNIKAGVSMGMAESYHDERNLECVLERADKALYQAKEGGRGRISFYTEPDKAVQMRAPVFEHFVDRQHELHTLRKLLDESITEGSRFAVISGEPGVGKTRLARELKHYTKFKGCLFLESKCSEFGASESYSMISQSISEVILSLDQDKQTEILSSVPPVHPTTAGLLSSLKLNVASDIMKFEPDQLKYRMFEDITVVFKSLTRLYPVVFLLDDLQWITMSDFELFSYLVRNTIEDRILFISPIRKPLEDYPQVLKQLKVLQAMVRVVQLDLKRLDEEYAKHMVMFALRDPNIPQDFLKQLIRQSGGNPFYLRELIKSLCEQGSIRSEKTGTWTYAFTEDLKLPTSIVEVIAARFEQLDELSQELLGIGSLALDAFSLDLLCEVSKQSQAKIVRALDRPLNAEFISEKMTKEGQLSYRFVHATVKNYVHGNLGETMIPIFHLRLAEYYEKQYLKGKEDVVVNIAHHYCCSSNQDKAKEYSLRAARLSEKRNSTQEVIGWLEKYISLITVEKEKREDIFYAYKTLGRFFSTIGNYDKATPLLEKALALASTLSEQGDIFTSIGRNFHLQNRFTDGRLNYTKALQLLVDPIKKAEPMYLLFFLAKIQGRIKEGLARLEELKQLADQCTDEQGKEKVLVYYYGGMGWFKDRIGSRSEALEFNKKALALTRKHKNVSGEASALNNIAPLLAGEGSYEKQLEILQKAEQINTKIGFAYSLSINYGNIGNLYLTLNKKDMVYKYYNRCIELAKAIGNDRTIHSAKILYAELLTEEGDFTAAELLYREALEISKKHNLNDKTTMVHLLMAKLFLKMDKCEAAQQIIASLEEEKDKEYFTQEHKTYLGFVKGLAYHLGASRNDQAAQAEAERLFEELLRSGQQKGFLTEIKIRYYLAHSLKLQGKIKRYCDAVKQAVGLLKEHLRGIRSKIFRDSFCERTIFKHLLNEYRDLGYDDDIANIQAKV
jgi:diguanylate cyclase (GGDEF)-like protein